MVATFIKQNKIGKMHPRCNDLGHSEIRNKRFRYKRVIEICQCIDKLVAVLKFVKNMKEKNLLYFKCKKYT